MKIENRQITKNITVYIAEDGEEFTTEADCKKHETLLHNRGYYKKLLEPKHITAIDGRYPYDEYTNLDTHSYFWYQIDNEEDLAILNKAYSFWSDCEVSAFPAIICVDEDLEGECYYYELSLMIETLNDLFKNVGYQIRKKEQ